VRAIEGECISSRFDKDIAKSVDYQDLKGLETSF